ncbi:hypothetical protein MKW94_021740 [Papaver nudicaule]|uniref:Uncharacterized protein n=1 Tax=Papaver nudicaule TaxID=74823 RepID=A0AA41VPD0_PAPNU|nr:hypothetical protein [Papaver nudicaule]
MEGEDGGDMPPFWLQSSNSSNYYNRNRRRSTNFLTNSGFLIVILTIIALFLIFIVVPSFLSFTSQYIKPHLVKKNWDSLNIVLVFFAIICGFLSRRTADDIPAAAADNGFSNLSAQRALVEEDEPVQMHHHHHQQQQHLRHRPMSMDQPWIGYSNVNPVMYNSMDNLSSLSSSNVRGMRRNSSSYPDLRQESLWSPAPESRRFYDDINVDGYQYGGAPDYLHRRHPSDPLPAPVPTEYQYNESNYLLHHNSAPVPATVPESDDTKYFSDTKTIPVDTFVVRQQEEESPEPPPETETTEEQPPPPSPKTPPPPPPPPAAETRRKERAERRTFRSVERREKPVEEKKEVEFEKVPTQSSFPPASPPPPAPPPPPPQSAKPSKSDQKATKSEKKRSSNAAKDIKNTFASLYNQRKNKKKNKQKSKESFDDMFHQMFDEPSSQSFVGPPPSPPPPPPPPPPPSSVFHQLFKKSSKTKKIHSDNVPPPPPPPPTTKQSRSSKRRDQNQDPSPSTPEASPPKQVRSPPKPEPSRRQKPSTPGKPPLPASRSSNTYFPSDELYLNSGNQSPLIPMPPPPPPPPFKMSAMKFVVRGDFVRIRSRTSRSGSPELLDDAPSAQESPMDTPISTPRVMDSTDGESSIPSSPFCPSPDVDYKADSFIARFRAGLKNGN